MTDPNKDALTWDTLTWQDIQAIGMALAEGHPDEPVLTLASERLARLAADLPGLPAGAPAPDGFTLSAIVTAWITALEGDDDTSPYDTLA
jgi:Fe-S-cluster formation regulator IscX/YfhJ